MIAALLVAGLTEVFEALAVAVPAVAVLVVFASCRPRDGVATGDTDDRLRIAGRRVVPLTHDTHRPPNGRSFWASYLKRRPPADPEFSRML